MNQLTQACHIILNQLTEAVQQLSKAEYVQPSKTLSGSSVGQHLRHTLEFFICLELGSHAGVINYDKRSHDKLIETDKEIALEVILRIREFVGRQTDKSLLLEVAYDLSIDKSVSVQTNYLRELTYNIEHAVHHMAIMKIGIREVAAHIKVSNDFGVAASTIRHREVALAEAN